MVKVSVTKLETVQINLTIQTKLKIQPSKAAGFLITFTDHFSGTWSIQHQREDNVTDKMKNKGAQHFSEP
jgi:hypothetical protein